MISKEQVGVRVEPAVSGLCSNHDLGITMASYGINMSAPRSMGVHCQLRVPVTLPKWRRCCADKTLK